MPALEIALRTAAILGCTLLASSLLRARRRDHTHYLGAAYCAGVVAFVLTSTPDSRNLLGVWLYPLTFLCVTKAALFWLFAKGLFTDCFRVTRRYLAIVGAIGAYGMWQQLIFMPSSGLEPPSGLAVNASLGFQLLVFGLVLLALGEAYRGLSVDLVEHRRRLRIVFVVAVAGYLAGAAAVQTYNFLLGVRTPPPLVLANLGLMFLVSSTVAWSLLRLRPASWLQAERQVKDEQLGRAEYRLLKALEHALEHERVYREEGLTIGVLASRLNAREYLLRRLINGHLGFRNFNDFLHSYRIREASRRLRHADEHDVPVLSIALDVGYASIGPFNRAFKSRIGMTPSAFRKRATADHRPA